MHKKFIFTRWDVMSPRGDATHQRRRRAPAGRRRARLVPARRGRVYTRPRLGGVRRPLAIEVTPMHVYICIMYVELFYLPLYSFHHRSGLNHVT